MFSIRQIQKEKKMKFGNQLAVTSIKPNGFVSVIGTQSMGIVIIIIPHWIMEVRKKWKNNS